MRLRNTSARLGLISKLAHCRVRPSSSRRRLLFLFFYFLLLFLPPAAPHHTAGTVFLQDWDLKLITALEKLPPNSVLSSPPSPTGVSQRACGVKRCDYRHKKNGDKEEEENGPFLESKFSLHPTETPLLQAGYTTSFVFSKCAVNEIVPHDAALSFVPSSVAHYARLWTRGYDSYTVPDGVCLDKRKESQRSIGQRPNSMRLPGQIRESGMRYNTLLDRGQGFGREGRATFGIYGAGKRRSLDSFREWIGASRYFKDGTVNVTCEGLVVAPYDEEIGETEWNDEYGCGSPFALSDCREDVLPVWSHLAASLNGGANEVDDPSQHNHPLGSLHYRRFDPSKIALGHLNGDGTQSDGLLFGSFMLFAVVALIVAVAKCSGRRENKMNDSRKAAIMNPLFGLKTV